MESSMEGRTRFAPVVRLCMLYQHAGVVMAVMCGGFRVVIVVEVADLRVIEGALRSESQARYEDLERKHLENDPNNNEEWEAWLLDPLTGYFHQLAHAGQHLRLRRLVEFIHPPTFTVRMLDHQGSLCPQFGREELDIQQEIWPTLELDASLVCSPNLDHVRLYNSADLFIDSDHRRRHFEPYEIPRVVRTTTHPSVKMLVKYIRSASSFYRELNALMDIDDYSLVRKGFNLPEIFGLLQDQKSGQIQGLLLKFIEHDCNLENAKGHDTAIRKKWADQIQTAVHALHGVGVTWSDVSPHNVLIDNDANAWITDFDGGWRDGWVSKEIHGTVEGDLEGLQKVLDFCLTEKQAHAQADSQMESAFEPEAAQPEALDDAAAVEVPRTTSVIDEVCLETSDHRI